MEMSNILTEWIKEDLEKERRKIKLKTIAYIFVFILVIGFTFVTSFNDKTYTVTVTDKERVNKSDSSKYLVFCEDENGEVLVFENTDELLRLKFNSSTVQGTIKQGGKYKLTVVGFRVPFLSMYQNIIKVEE